MEHNLALSGMGPCSDAFNGRQIYNRHIDPIWINLLDLLGKDPQAA